MKWLFVLRGEDLDLHKVGLADGKNPTTPLQIAKRNTNTVIASLLERFTADPVETQYELRVELGLPESRASQIS